MSPSSACRDGYVTDIPYPDYFHRELMPVWLCSTLQALGRKTPDLRRSYTWLELGCGTGLSTVIAAATNPLGHFIGLDINPEAIARAQALAQAAGVGNAQFLCCSFDEALQRAQLPACDFVVSHGVYSWISPANRQSLLRLVQQCLQPGGILYLAYMSQPGSASMAAAQKLAQLAVRDVPGSSIEKAAAALALLSQMADSGTGYIAEHPRVAQEVQRLRAMDAHYIAHEFLNEHWDSLHVADVIRDLQQVDCDYAGSATPLENVDAASLPAQSLGLLQSLRQQGASQAVQETLKDLARNQNQRRDLCQRQHPQGNLLSEDSHRQLLLQQRVMLLPQAPAPQAQLPAQLTLETRIGPMQMSMAHVAPLLEALQNGTRSYAELIALPLYAQQPGSVSQLLQLLAWSGWLQFVRPDWNGKQLSADAAVITRLNAELATRPCGPQATRYSAAAATGNAVDLGVAPLTTAQVERLHQLGTGTA